jgi:ATP/maltotriose-dependent transcriptional regulator MalT
MVEHGLGHLSMQRGEWDCAEQHLKEALERWRALDDTQWEIVALYMLGKVAGYRGEQEESQIWFSDCLDLARSSGVLVPIAFTLNALGNCALERGNHREAANLFAEALTLAQDRNVPRTVANCLQSLGAVAAIDGKAERAARLFGAAEGINERLGRGEGPEAERLRLEREIAPARNRLPCDVFAEAWTAGRKLSIDQAIAEALEVASDFTWANTQVPETPAGLSVRELDVLRLLVEGFSDKEIGETLGISRRTVSKHVEAILSKLAVPSRTAAAILATRHRLV